jgi:hypothetical protein
MKTISFPLFFLLFFMGCGWNGLNAQNASTETWQPDFNDDRLLSMPDILPLLGYFGSEWGGLDREGPETADTPRIHVLDWSGRTGESLVLPAAADVVVFIPGAHESESDQSTSIRHIRVESWLSDAASLAHIKQQVLLLQQGKNTLGRTMPYGTLYILHFPDGSKGEVSTNSIGSMSVSGKPLRTMARLFHAGGQVYFEQ